MRLSNQNATAEHSRLPASNFVVGKARVPSKLFRCDNRLTNLDDCEQ
jgi:hypothetical protein